MQNYKYKNYKGSITRVKLADISVSARIYCRHAL